MTVKVLLLFPLLLCVWLAYDVGVAAYLRPRFGTPTLTSEVIRLSKLYPAVPFLTGLVIGLVCGHLFGQF